MFRFSCFLVAVFVVCPGAIGSGVPGATNEGVLPESLFPELADLLRLSAHRAPRMLEEGFREEEARGEARVSRSGRYPSVSGNFRYVSRYEERSDLDGSRTGLYPQAGLTVRQPVYHWGSLRAEDRAGRIREEMAANNRAEAFRLLVLEVRGRYLEFAVRRKEIAVADREAALAEREWESGRALFERDETTAEELEDRRLARDEAAVRAERLRRRYDSDRDAFLRLVGDDAASGRVFPEAIPAFSPGNAEGLGSDPGETAREGPVPPHLENARQRVREAESRREAERSRLRPNVNLVAGVSQDQVAVFDRRDIDRTVFFAGVEVSWNIFDGFEARGRRAAATARQRLEERRRDRLEREWAAGLDRLEGAIGFAERELALAEGRLDLARDNLERSRSEFEAGRRSGKELAQSRVVHAKRELAVTEKRADYLMQWAELLSESGLDPMMRYYRAAVQGRAR